MPRSADTMLEIVLYFSFKIKEHLKIKFSSVGTLSLIQKIKHMLPCGLQYLLSRSL